MQKLVWRVKLVADLGDEAAETEVEVSRIERDEFTVPETLSLSLSEGKRLTAAIQPEMVCAQAATMGERFRCRAHCESTLSRKGYRSVTFRSSSATCRFVFVGSRAANAVKSRRSREVSRR